MIRNESATGTYRNETNILAMATYPAVSRIGTGLIRMIHNRQLESDAAHGHRGLCARSERWMVEN